MYLFFVLSLVIHMHCGAAITTNLPRKSQMTVTETEQIAINSKTKPWFVQMIIKKQLFTSTLLTGALSRIHSVHSKCGMLV